MFRFFPRTKKSALREALRERLLLQACGEAALGLQAWSLLYGYGKLMAGPHGGQYLSGVPVKVARAILMALVRGEVVDVHLMHRHQSGKYEASRLALVDGQLVMLFADRTVPARMSATRSSLPRSDPSSPVEVAEPGCWARALGRRRRPERLRRRPNRCTTCRPS